MIPSTGSALLPDARVLFRVAAGPRRGYGHLLRSLSLARALGVPPVVALRGDSTARAAALRLGARLVHGTAASLLRRPPALLVIDDPSRARGAEWLRQARRRGVAVASVHDQGRGWLASDLLIDGSVTILARSAPPVPRALIGTRFVILDPALATTPAVTPRARQLLVALGGGRREALARRLAIAIALGRPDLEVRVAGGFASPPPASLPSNVRWLGALPTLRDELARCLAAVVGGGVTLYEACCTGTPVVAVPVVRAQVPTVRGFVAAGAALGLAAARRRSLARRAARKTLALLSDAALRRRLARAGRQRVDGWGAVRVARELGAFLGSDRLQS